MMTRGTPFSSDVRECAVRVASDRQGEHGSRCGDTLDIGQKRLLG